MALHSPQSSSILISSSLRPWTRPAPFSKQTTILRHKRKWCNPRREFSPQAQPEDAGQAGAPNATTEEAFQTAENCMKLFLAGEGDCILEYLPDQVIDSALERKRSRLGDSGVKLNDLTLPELLELAPASDFSADAFAMRACVLQSPASATALSTLRISPALCLQRYAVQTVSGEEMVLVLRMELAEALEPKYRSLRVVTRWFLASMQGEPADAATPEQPHRQHGPESIVQAQLVALQARDVGNVFAFASPRNKDAFPGGLEQFGSMLQSETYAPLLGHASAELLRCTQLTPDRAFAVVGVTTTSSGGPAAHQSVFGWALGLQGAETGPLQGCWLTESVYPLTMGGGAGFIVP